MNQTMKKPVDYDELYPGRFLKAGELLGRKVTVTISSVDLDMLESDSGKKVKGVVSFKETQKQLALNRTNGICLREMFGRQIPQWEGKRITLFPDEWNGEPCIRIWGSPDINEDRKIQIALPRRRPIPMTMHAMRSTASQKQGQQPKAARGGSAGHVPEPGSMDDEPGFEREPGMDG